MGSAVSETVRRTPPRAMRGKIQAASTGTEGHSAIQYTACTPESVR
jgi:hypothetical protein